MIKKATTKKKASRKKTATRKKAAKKTTKKTGKKTSSKKKTSRKKTAPKKPAKKKTTRKRVTKKKAKRTETSKTTGSRERRRPSLVVESHSEPCPARPFTIERIVSGSEIRAEMSARKAELEQQKKNANKVLRKLSRTLDAKKCKYGEVTGYSVALRTKLEFIVSPLQYVIEIHVPCKLTDRVMDVEENITRIPDEIDGVPIKVIEASPDFAVGETCFRDGSSTYDPSNPVHRDNPQLETSCSGSLRGGFPIFATSPSNWGTLALAIPTKSNVDDIALTNAHIAPSRTRVKQPALEMPTTVDEIGVVKRGHSKFKKTRNGSNTIDAAIITLEGTRPIETKILHL